MVPSGRVAFAWCANRRSPGLFRMTGMLDAGPNHPSCVAIAQQINSTGCVGLFIPSQLSGEFALAGTAGESIHHVTPIPPQGRFLGWRTVAQRFKQRALFETLRERRSEAFEGVLILRPLLGILVWSKVVGLHDGIVTKKNLQCNAKRNTLRIVAKERMVTVSLRMKPSQIARIKKDAAKRREEFGEYVREACDCRAARLTPSGTERGK